MRRATLIIVLCLVLSFGLLAQTGEIALSFDDAPNGDSEYFSGMERTETLIHKLKELNVPQVVFFCNSRKFDYAKGRQRIQMYSDAGHLIGNHSHSHYDLDKIGVNEYLKDIARAHDSLSTFQAFVPWFRYPMLHEGKSVEKRDSVRNALEDMGYRNGYVTVDNFDFYLNRLFRDALKDGKTVDFEGLKQAYVKILWDAILFYDHIARETLGRSPKHVLLLHENDLAALCIDELVKHIRSQGWEIISPAEAYRDPIADMVPDVLRNNQGRVAAIAKEMGYPGPLHHESEDTEFLDNYFEKEGIFK